MIKKNILLRTIFYKYFCCLLLLLLSIITDQLNSVDNSDCTDHGTLADLVVRLADNVVVVDNVVDNEDYDVVVDILVFHQDKILVALALAVDTVDNIVENVHNLVDNQRDGAALMPS